jgi:hypothetical protein
MDSVKKSLAAGYDLAVPLAAGFRALIPRFIAKF